MNVPICAGISQDGVEKGPNDPLRMRVQIESHTRAATQVSDQKSASTVPDKGLIKSSTVIPAQGMREKGFGVYANGDKGSRDQNEDDGDGDQGSALGVWGIGIRNHTGRGFISDHG